MTVNPSSERLLEHTTASGTWVFEPGTPPKMWWSPGTRKLFGLEEDAALPPFEDTLAMFADASRRALLAAIESAVAGLGGWSLDLELQSSQGPSLWLRSIGSPVVEDGRTLRIVGSVQDVSDRHSAECRASELQAENRELEERLQLATDGSGLGVWDWDLPSRDVYYSETWKQMLGYDEGEIGSDLDEWHGRLHPDDREAVHAQLDAHLQGVAEHVAVESRLRCRDGSYKWVLTRGRVVRRGPDGSAQRMVGTTADISHAKSLEQAVQEARARYQSIFDSTYQFIGLCDLDGCIIEGNRAALEFMGVDAADMVGRALWDAPCWRRDDATRERLRADLAKARAGETVQYAIDICGSQDRTATIDFSLRPLRDDDGNVCLLLAEGHDMTKLIAAQRSLDERERLFSASFDDSPIGAALVSLQGEWLEVNSALSTILGYSRRALLARTFQDITHPDDLDADLGNVQALIDGKGQHYRMDKRYLHANGGIVQAQLDVTIIRDKDGLPLYFLSQIQDITERREMREAILREKELAQVTLAAIADGVIRTDTWGRVTFVNEPALRLLRLVSLDVDRRPFDEVVQVVNDSDEHHHPMRRVLYEGLPGELPDDATLLLRDGSRLPIEGSANPIRDRERQLIGGVFVFRDVSATRQLAQQLRYQASHDPLTGLPNRRELQRSLEALRIQARTRGGEHYLMMLDLDHFKAINDQCGHEQGDKVLIQVVSAMKQRIRACDVLARLGGDEFALLLPDCSKAKAWQLGEGLVQAVSHMIVEDGEKRLPLGLSVGMTAIERGSRSASSLLKQADASCYRAKQQGRNCLYATADPDEGDSSVVGIGATGS